MIQEFEWLIEHDGWQPAPSLPEDQGVDTRERIVRDGVIFSAYRIPRGGSVFGRVELDPLPQWAQSTGLGSSTSVEELQEKLGIKPDGQYPFRALNSRFEDLRSYLVGNEFARSRLSAEIDALPTMYASQRNVLRGLRGEIGLIAVMKAVIGSRALERRTLAKFRRALQALRNN